MKNYIKNCSKFLLFLGFILLSFEVFSASEATKKLIHDVLAKYGISAGGKEVCGRGKEPDYNQQTGVVKCKNEIADPFYTGDTNNCWDKESRLCKTCPYTTVVSQNDHITCRKIICPEGYELVEVKNGNCPEGFELKQFSKNSCPSNDFESYTEIQATNDYSTQSIHCKNVRN